MKKSETTPTPKIFAAIGVLIIVGIIVNAVDIFAYRKFLTGHNIGWFDRVPLGLLWEYISTPIGATLTFFSLAPWVVLLGWLYIGSKIKANQSSEPT